MGRVVVLDYVPVHAVDAAEFAMQFHRLEAGSFRRDFYLSVGITGGKMVCDVRDEGVLAVLKRYLVTLADLMSPVDDYYRWDRDDIIYVVVRKAGCRNKEVSELTVNDLEFYRLVIGEGCWL